MEKNCTNYAISRTESEQDNRENSKKSVLSKLVKHGLLNEDSKSLTFRQVRYLAKQLGIPDFKVLDLKDYIVKANKYKEPANCIIYVPWKNQPNRGHFVSCFRESDGVLNYQDSFGQVNEFPLDKVKRKFKINKVRYQSMFSNNCAYLALLHLYTHDKIDPVINEFI